jgi:HlyD family type I secretion membrane fusion protein
MSLAAPSTRSSILASFLARNTPSLWRRIAPPSPRPDADTGFMDAGSTLRTGGAVLAGFAIVFMGWGGFAPLDSAVVAPGVVVVESHRKAIQHLEGGIVAAVLVREGQHVKAGQPLVKLDQTQARASYAALREHADGLAAQEARLLAEKDGKDSITFAPDLLARAATPSVAQAMAGEENTFASYRDTLAKRVDILNSRIAQNERIVAGLETERRSLDTQLELIQREVAPVQRLFDQKLDTLQHLLSIKRQQSIIEGNRGETVQKIAQTRLSIDETRMQIQNLRNERLNTVVDQLREVQAKRLELTNRLQSAGDIFNRVTLSAPDSGHVVALSVHTRGAVIKPGETLLEIVPDRDLLEVEAHLRPEDADEAYPGMPALVRLTGYRQRRLPVTAGRVTQVSADRLTDQRTGQAYFNVLVRVDRAPLKDHPGARLMPGIPVEVSLKTGSRTALDYLVEPITDVMHRGMRER